MDIWGERKRNPGTAKINSPDSFTVTVEVFALTLLSGPFLLLSTCIN